MRERGSGGALVCRRRTSKRDFFSLCPSPLWRVCECVCSPSLAHAKIPGRKEEKSGPTERAPIACEGEETQRNTSFERWMHMSGEKRSGMTTIYQKRA